MQDTQQNLGDIEALRKDFSYNPVTGEIYNNRLGRVVGGKNVGYLTVWVNDDGRRKRILAHRLAWALHYGQWVTLPAEIDHVNGNRSDNRLGNLRIVSRQVQMRNVPIGRNNKTGATGVSYCKQTKRYAATININRKQIWLGRHDSLNEAIAVRKAAEKRYGWPAKMQLMEVYT